MINNTRVNEVAESGVVLTIVLTAIGYLVSYFFNLGYLTYFRIPSAFISISVTTLIFNITITFFVGLALVYYLARYLSYEIKHKGKKKVLIFRIVWIAVIIFTTLYALGLLTVKFVSFILIITILVFTVLNIHSMIREKSIIFGWKVYWKSFRNAPNHKDSVFSLLPDRLVIYVSVAVFSATASLLVGGFSARTQNVYPSIVSQGNTRTLIITKNNTELITKDYDIESRQFNNGYEIQNINGSLRLEQFILREPNSSMYQYFQLDK